MFLLTACNAIFGVDGLGFAPVDTAGPGPVAGAGGATGGSGPGGNTASAGGSNAAGATAASSTSASAGGGGSAPTGCADPTRHIVFLSAATMLGSQGVASFDNLCNVEAGPHCGSKSFVAWVSTQTFNAPDRIPDAMWHRPDDVLVASSKSDLLDYSIANPINVRADGTTEATFAQVWTGTDATGIATGEDCSGWTASGGNGGTCGRVDQIDNDWTDYTSNSCSQLRRLYCFQTP